MARKKGKHFTQRGVALIMVITALIVIGLVSGEFTANTMIDTYGADDARDQMRAEFLARSSLNLSEMILRIQQLLDGPQARQLFGNLQITDYADLFMSAFGGTTEELNDQGISGDMAKSYGGEIGSFGVKISTDDGKINVNCANGKPEYAQLAYTLIDSLYYFPAFDAVFQDADAEGWRRDRETQTKAIIDFIDSDQSQASPPGQPRSGAAEDYGYETLPDRYKAKNNYLDTVDEMKLIRGVDDRFWTLFGPSFTIYGGCKINVRAVDDPRIIAAVIYLSAKDPNDPRVRDGAQLWYNALAASWAKQNGYSFGSVQDFADFVKDPYGKLSETLSHAAGVQGGSSAPSATTSAGSITIPGIPPGTPLGIELDIANLRKIMIEGPRRTYRVEAWGETQRAGVFNQVRREVTAVWDMGNINSNQRSQDTKAKNGAWVYLHEQ